MVALRAQNTLIINELMQSNIDCLMDDQNEFPDSWVEVYNPTAQAINLNGYKLGITRNAGEAYQLPSLEVAAGGRAVIWCDKGGTGRHTHFRLESGNGCCVYLYQGSAFADSVSGLQKQPSPNIAYGRQTDGSSTWGYQAVPTPGAANCGTVYSQCLPDPVFSIPGQVFSGTGTSISLQITVPQDAPAGTVVRYTTDGTEPTEQSNLLDGTMRFSTTRLIKARLFCAGYLSPRSVTQSYIFHGRQMTLPVISIVGKEEYFYDNQIGILVDGTYSSSQKNYKYDWRRPINFELFEASEEASVLNQLCEARVCGAASRDLRLKSLALYAHKRFGTKRFRYEFFPDQRPGETNYKSIALRNAGNDFDYLYMRDAIIQRAMAQYADMDWQAWRPAIVYINGVYKGMLNIRERGNEDNVFTNYNELEDITMMENFWNLQAGTWDEWNNFKTFIHTKGHTWQEYEQMLDCKEYINVMIDELFFNNQDFPGNNIVYWKPNQATDSLPARWRLLVKDTDFGLGLYGGKYTADFNTIAWMYDPNYDSSRTWANTYEYTRMFRYAMQNADFQREFVDRAAIYMGDFLNFDRIWPEIWQPMYQEIINEYRSYHRPIFNQWWPNYNDELYNARVWLTQRPANFTNMLVSQYSLGTTVPMLINDELTSADTAGLHVSFNDVRLTRPVWNGTFYQSHTVRLSGSTDVAGETVSGWVIKYKDSTGKISVSRSNGAALTINIPSDCKQLTVNAVVQHGTDLDYVDLTEQDKADTHKFMLDGRLYIEREGIIYDVVGNRVSE